jgi:hypothetical protein
LKSIGDTQFVTIEASFGKVTQAVGRLDFAPAAPDRLKPPASCGVLFFR